MAPSEQIFEFVCISIKTLIKLKVELLPKVTKLKKDDEIRETLKEHHYDPVQGCHCGFTKSLNKIKRHFHWPNLTKDIAKYVKSVVSLHSMGQDAPHRSSLKNFIYFVISSSASFIPKFYVSLFEFDLYGFFSSFEAKG